MDTKVYGIKGSIEDRLPRTTVEGKAFKDDKNCKNGTTEDVSKDTKDFGGRQGSGKGRLSRTFKLVTTYYGYSELGGQGGPRRRQVSKDKDSDIFPK